MSPSEVAPAARTTSPRVGLAARLRGGFGGHLGDGLAMALAAGGSALVGMLSWILAARALTPTQLGTATAFVSGFLLVAGCTELNVGIGLLRWLPRAGGAAGTLLIRAGLAISLFSASFAVVYLMLPEASIIVDAVVGATGDRVLGGAVFVVAAVLYAWFQQQDFVLVGLGRAWWAPARTVLFAVGRLSILLVAGASLTTELVVASWVVPTAACVLLVTLQTVVLAWRRRGRPRWMPRRREVVGFLGPTYVGQMATSVLVNQVPLLITFRLGPESGAAFFLVWQAATVVDVLALYFVSSLSGAVAREPARAAELSRATRRRLLGLMLPALALGVVIAEPVLALFGSVYAAEADLLRVMLVGLALRLVVIHRLGEHQAMGRSVRFARLAVVNALLVVGIAALPAVTANPLMTVVLGFVVVQAVLALTVTLRRRQARPEPADDHDDEIDVRPGGAAPAEGAPRSEDG